MLTKLLVAICRISPLARKLLWRWWYSKLARKIASGRWTFMNYGHTDAAVTGEPNQLVLEPGDEPDRLCIQLYDRVVGPANLKGAEVLEVGSGRGGGASFLARYRKPSMVTGIDFSPQAVAFCRERHGGVANLKFEVGDAERLPFADATFDTVVNVESSHCYGDVGKFFGEVYRVLRPGGWFLFADFREPHELPELEGLLRAHAWSTVEHEDITPGVLEALNLDDARKRQLIADLVPQSLRGLFDEFAGLAGGKIHRAFTERSMIYLRFAARK